MSVYTICYAFSGVIDNAYSNKYMILACALLYIYLCDVSQYYTQ